MYADTGKPGVNGPFAGTALAPLGRHSDIMAGHNIRPAPWAAAMTNDHMKRPESPTCIPKRTR